MQNALETLGSLSEDTSDTNTSASPQEITLATALLSCPEVNRKWTRGPLGLKIRHQW